MSGITRKLDELGRIVIPKEMRRNIPLKPGDEIEIDLVDNKIVLEKYSVFFKIEDFLQEFIEVLGKELNKDILIFDKNKICCQYKVNLDSLKYENISDDLYEIITENKTEYIIEDLLKLTTKTIEGNFVINSIYANGDMLGGILIYSKDNSLNSKDIFILNMISKTIAKYMEE